MALKEQVQNNKRMESWLRHDRWLPLISGDNLNSAMATVLTIIKDRPNHTLIEVGLRSPNALQTLRDLKLEMPQLRIGGGTVLSEKTLRSMVDIGADFAVSPGFQPALARLAKDLDIAYLPGVMTPSEVTTALHFGYRCLKFFPAKAAGGVNMLKTLAGPFPQVCFCPTGGISENDKGEYLDLEHVIAVGGSVKKAI